MMEDKRYQIFISSTYEDLKSARQKVLETILSLYHFPIGMEMFSADDAEQWEIIRQTIDRSDYYLVLIGHRYGSETSEGASYTEKEYDYAREQGIPILAFVRRRNIATTPDERDTEPEKTIKLESFIKKAIKSKMCDFWDSPEELGRQVAVALVKIFNRAPRVGWVRSDQAVSAKVSEEIASLSKENRELRDDLARLQAQIDSKKPLIDVRFNGGNSLNLALKANDKMIAHFNGNPVDLSLKPPLNPLAMGDIPEHLRQYISGEDIENYNEFLPSPEVVGRWNDDIELYWRIKQTGVLLNLFVHNIGTTKANDIFVEIIFPPQVLILEKQTVKDYKFPNNPFPENPIFKAKEKYKQDQKRKANPLGFFNDMQGFLNPSFLHPPDFEIKSLAETLSEIRDPVKIRVSENKILLEIESLLHTRQIQFEGLAMVPLATGTFDAKIFVMCEEYSEEQNSTVTINVADENRSDSG
jgi:hypothetical protein